jgi:hypothetical protein
MIIDRKEYRDYPALNQSKLKLIVNPSLFKNYNPPEDDGEEKDHLRTGTFLDEWLTSGDSIWERYIKADGKLPTAPVQKIIKATFDPLKNIDDCRSALLLRAKAEEYRNNIKDEDKLFAAIAKDGKEYWEFLKKCDGKIIISTEEYDIFSHNFVLLNNIFNNEEFLPKVCLVANHKGVIIKGELDYLRVNVDKVRGTYKVVDLKSTADIYQFPFSILKYRYDFQMAFYELLVELNLKELGIEGYTKLPGDWYTVSNAHKAPMKRFTNTLNSRLSFDLNGRKYMGVDEAIEKYLWHTENGIWEHSPEYYINNTEAVRFDVKYLPTPNQSTFKQKQLSLEL